MHPSPRAPAGPLVELAARLAEARTLPETLAVAVSTAHDLLPAVDHVGVTLVDRDEG